jgi:hypothetical protein
MGAIEAARRAGTNAAAIALRDSDRREDERKQAEQGRQARDQFLMAEILFHYSPSRAARRASGS